MGGLPRRHRDRAVRAAEKIARARRALREGREELARSRRPGQETVFYDAWGQRAARALERELPKLRGCTGMRGVGLGTRRVRGIDTGERCAVVFVSQKRRDALVPVPRTLGDEEIPVDVVELGAFRRHAHVGCSLGIKPGRSKGTLGAVGVDIDSRDKVAVTAMHVCSDGEGQELVYTPSWRDDGHQRVFGHFLAGVMERTDAAKIGLRHPESVLSEAPGIGAIRGWRQPTVGGDEGTAVRIYGASSGRQSGIIAYPSVTLEEESVDCAILVEDLPTRYGDSGAGLLDNENLLLGFLVGSAGDYAVFTPADIALGVLGCDVPTKED